MIKKVAFIGLSTMGKPMAINIAQAGYDLMAREEPAPAASPLCAIRLRPGIWKRGQPQRPAKAPRSFRFEDPAAILALR